MENNTEPKKKKVQITIIVVIILVTICTINIICSIISSNIIENRKTYLTEEQMKSELQGEYNINYFGKILFQIIIKDNKIIKKEFCATDIDLVAKTEYDIKEWNYKKGIIVYERGTIEIKKDGNLKEGEDTYEKSISSKYYSESSSNALKISDINVTSNSSYTICTGQITNHGKKTYNYIQIKGAFKDERGSVIKNGWTLAVGAEGLAPGETKSFEISVPKKSYIVDCSVKIMDYN